MISSSLFFLLEIKFSSPDANWPSRYLTSMEDRLTFILRDQLKNEFWENYAQRILYYFKSGQLLLRAKYICDSFVILTQVWRSKEDYISFVNEAIGENNFRTLLEAKGFTITETESLTDETFCINLIQQIQEQPHLFQFIIDKWQTDKMTVSDPLKKGRNYLPYPNQ